MLSAPLAVLTILSNFRYQMTVPLPVVAAHARRMVDVCLWLNFTSSVLVLFVVSIFGESICELTGTPSLKIWLLFVPLMMLTGGSAAVYQIWALRNDHYFGCGMSKFFGALMTGTVGVAGGLVGGGFITLLYGRMAGPVFALALLFRYGRKVLVQYSPRHYFMRMRVLLRRYRDFPTKGLLPIVLNTLAASLPVLVIATFYGAMELGWYYMASRVLLVPVQMLGDSLKQVLYQSAANRSRERLPVRPLFMRVMLALGAMMVPVSLFVALCGPAVFAFFLGEDWRVAGGFSAILAIAIPFKMTGSCLGCLFLVNRRIGTQSVWQYAYFLISMIGVVYLACSYGIEGFLWGTVVIDVIMYSVYIGVNYYTCRSSDHQRLIYGRTSEFL